MKVLRNGKAVEKVDPPADEVERVAKAIAKVRECEPTVEQVASCIWGHDNVDGYSCICLVAARAAIMALPEPPPDPRDATIGTDVSDAAIADATIARLSAELEAAREALDPFAAYAEWLSHLSDESNVLSFHRGRLDWLHLIAGDFRRARAVLAKLAKGE